MRDWYQPDDRWPTLGIRNREEYVDWYVYEGRFHAGVPEDVVRSYETVSRLMAQAWYCFPLYDEALVKLLFIQEMAIKLRGKQLEIPATFTSNGKRKRHTLQTLIDELSILEPAKQIATHLHRARDLRNHFAHPEIHSFGGGMFRHHMLPLLNLLNELFVENTLVARAGMYVEQLRQQRSQFGQGLLVLEWEGKSVLITDAQPLIAHWVHDEWRVIWRFSPMVPRVLGVITGHQIYQPIVLVLTDLNFQEGIL